MQKSFKNIDEQIELLKSRGLTIEDENIEYVRKYFLTNNYYDIIKGMKFLDTHDQDKSTSHIEEITK